MADSIDVLATLKLVYGIYALIAISLIAWFGYRITKPKDDSSGPKPVLFWTYVAVLVVVGTGLHFLTYNAVPWVPIDLKRASIQSDAVFDITYEDHQMSFSSFPMQVGCGEHVVFNATSNDLTYGFGIFRTDHTMVAQMQVVPQSRNDLMWKFEKNGTYYVRSTEYSGPKGARMVARNAIIVTGCDQDDLRAVAMGGQS
ncbi:MAG: cytochrome C oxidase subunit II [Gammaproteobacteria bacterium]|jgi:cytochrome c oxidase subunit 2|nr:cytochrome C oxidase subunit II [Gammaproteobacteria bacterium]